MNHMHAVALPSVQIKAAVTVRNEETRRKSTKTVVFSVPGVTTKEDAHQLIREALDAQYGPLLIDFSPATARTMNVFTVQRPLPIKKTAAPRVPRSRKEADLPPLPPAHDTTINPFRPSGKTKDGKVMKRRYRVVCSACETNAVATDKKSAEMLLARHNEKPVRK